MKMTYGIAVWKKQTLVASRQSQQRIPAFWFCIAIIFALMIMPFNILAQGVPGAINYQGQLLDSGGVPVTTPVTIIFSLWDSATTGTPLGSAWSDSDTVTPDANGVYSTEIGDEPGNPVPTTALVSGSVWLNVNVGGEDLAPRTRLLSVPYAVSANTLNGEAYVTVPTTSDAITNGLNLITAYNTVKAFTPHGATLSATNRVTVLVPPGRYNLTTASLLLDTEFVDLIGLTSARDDQYIFGLGVSDGSTTGVLRQTANNVRIENLFIECTLTSGSLSFRSTDPAAYSPDDAATTDTVIRNCTFKANDTNASSMRVEISYPGTYKDCKGGDYAFGGFGGAASGRFVNCTGGIGAFGGFFGTASGRFINCTGGSSSFGGTAGTASGTFINCRGGSSSFGGNFDGNAIGMFFNCIGGFRSFGSDIAGTAAGGRFYYCQGGGESIPLSATLRRFCDVDGVAIND